MAIALVHTTGANTLTVTIPSTTAGNCLVVCIASYGSGLIGSISGITLGGCTVKAWRALSPRPGTAGMGPTGLFPLRLRRPVMIIMFVTELSLGLGLAATAGRIGDVSVRVPATIVRTATALFFLIAVGALNEMRQRRPDSGCGCFGELSDTPIGLRTIARSVLLAASAVATIGVPPLRMPSSSAEAELWLAVLAFELALIAFLSPELGEILVRLGYSEPCELPGDWPLSDCTPEAVALPFRKMLEAIPAADRGRLDQTIKNTLQTHEPFDVDHRIVRRDGTIRVVRSRGQIVAGQDGSARLVGTTHDITDLRLAHEKLRHSEERFRSLVANIPAVIWSSDVHGQTQYISPNAEPVFGFTSEEMCEKGAEIWFERICPNDSSRVVQAFHQLFSEGRPFDVEYRVQHKDGTWIWVHDRAYRTYERDGVRCADGFISNITERKRTEERLRKLSRAVEQSPASVVITDVRGTIEYVNPKFAQLTGYAPEEAIGQNPRFLKSGMQPAAVYRELWETVLSGGEWRGELANRKKNGEIYWESASIVPIRDSAGTITHLLAVKEDITERKRADKELRLAQFSLEHASDAVYWMNPQGRIVYVNQAACCSLGRSREELLSLSIPDIDPLFPKEAWAAHWEELKARGSMSIETQHQTKQGRVFPVEVTTNYLEFDGKEYSFAFARDISERKRAEEALQESEQRYRLLFAEMVVGFALLEVIYDEDGQPCDHRYLELNPAFETHSGLSRDRALGKTIREVIPDIEPFWIETYGKVATTGESVHFENYVQALQKWFEVTAFRTRQGQVAV